MLHAFGNADVGCDGVAIVRLVVDTHLHRRVDDLAERDVAREIEPMVMDVAVAFLGDRPELRMPDVDPQLVAQLRLEHAEPVMTPVKIAKPKIDLAQNLAGHCGERCFHASTRPSPLHLSHVSSRVECSVPNSSMSDVIVPVPPHSPQSGISSLTASMMLRA